MFPVSLGCLSFVSQCLVSQNLLFDKFGLVFLVVSDGREILAQINSFQLEAEVRFFGVLVLIIVIIGHNVLG